MIYLRVHSLDNKVSYHIFEKFPLCIGNKKECDLCLEDIPNEKYIELNKEEYSNLVNVKSTNQNDFLIISRGSKDLSSLQNGDVFLIGTYLVGIYFSSRNKNEISKDEEENSILQPGNSKLIVNYQYQDYVQLLRSIMEILIDRMNLKKLSSKTLSDNELKNKVETRVNEILNELDTQIPDAINRQILKNDILSNVLGLGPLQELINDDTITEIMVNSADEIYVERNGKVIRTERSFIDDQQIMAVIERIIAPIGRVINESNPIVDARLVDGSRFTAIIPPLSLKGISITIRKFSSRRLNINELLRMGTLSQAMLDYLIAAVEQKRNIIISGGSGTGKTTLLNILSHYIPDFERIITIEDTAELRLQKSNVVTLESRPPNIEGKGSIKIGDILRASLRMRPDRIIIGECRGGEALDMLQAMNTGHDGSITTIHANSPRDVVSRLETFVLTASSLPSIAIRDQIASAIQTIVHISRMADGSRKITQISEIIGIKQGKINIEDIFFYKIDNYDENGRVNGAFRATGAIPQFMQELNKQGGNIDLQKFNPG